MSTNHRYTRSPFARAVTLLTLLAVVFSAAAASAPVPASAAGNIEEIHEHAADVDARTGAIAPTAAQKSTAAGLGAAVRWNEFGTPKSLIKYDGYLGTRPAGTTAETAARDWLAANAALFGLSSSYLANVNSLKFVNDSPMRGSNGHAVIFRQTYGGSITATHDGMVTVGLVGTKASGWKIAYLSSSLTKKTTLASTDYALTARQAWLKAARYNGFDVAASAITREAADRLETGSLKSDWRIMTVTGFAQQQRARYVAFPVVSGGVASVRPAYETIVLETDESGHNEAYTTFVDAVSGKVWLRLNQLQQFSQFAPASAPTTGEFSGAITALACGPSHSFVVGAGQKSIAVVATADVPANDIILNLKLGTTTVATSDTATSPEAVLYQPSGGVAPGTYAVQVCPFPDGLVTDPAMYRGTYATSETAVSAFPFPPKWKYFTANPEITAFPYSSTASNADTRIVGCWVSVTGCMRQEKNLASRVPWDHDVQANTPTFTTRGNNAFEAETWYSPNTVQFGNITPGATGYMPVDLNREYVFPWTNQWYTSKCDPAALAVPGVGNDISAATTNLFVEHNRVHDWSYFLGFTEQNYNMQVNNFGNTAPGPYPAGREGDPEVGDVQAGAVTGSPPQLGGRDNANQITLNDGIAPITNMYLWQPLVAAFYAPCVDGDFDMSVIAHEYGHAIQNRMVAGPDSGLSGGQARSMGESWSDLTAIEYLNEYGYAPTNDENRFAVGAYVTGNKQAGIRNYGMNASPLNYSALDYDPNGVAAVSPHSNGEIWSATNYDIRQALVAKYNGSFPATDASLQRACADGQRPAGQCPGNRRWFQILMDAFLLMPSDVSMLDARDAYLAADRMRFNGANQTELWRAFARRGMGILASSNGTDDVQATPNFESPLQTNRAVRFVVVAPNESNAVVKNAKLYVGRYEARAVPIADTDPNTALTDAPRFVPGTYEFVVQAPGYGMLRFRKTITTSTPTQRVSMPTNYASRVKGARASGDGVNKNKLIDDTENTNWFEQDDTGIAGSRVTVNLAGGVRTVRSVQVSALLRPRIENDRGDDDGPVDRAGDTESQSRFSALRQFDIQVCTASAGNDYCSGSLGYTRIYRSSTSAFPGDAPRPLAPDLLLRAFDVPDTQATHVRLVVRTNQCTGGPKYQGEQDNDPRNPTDCSSFEGAGGDGDADGLPDISLLGRQNNRVRAAELQVFTSAGSVRDGRAPSAATVAPTGAGL